MDRIFTIYALVIKFNAFKHSISPNFHSHSIRNLRNELRLMVLFRFENDRSTACIHQQRSRYASYTNITSFLDSSSDSCNLNFRIKGLLGFLFPLSTSELSSENSTENGNKKSHFSKMVQNPV